MRTGAAGIAAFEFGFWNLGTIESCSGLEWFSEVKGEVKKVNVEEGMTYRLGIQDICHWTNFGRRAERERT